MNCLLGLTAGGLLNSQAFAADLPESPPAWKTEVGLGYVKTTGNTRTESIKGTAKTVHELQQWRQSASLEALNTSDNGKTTAERYLLSGKIDYKYSAFNYWYVTATYENDRFSGYDYRTSESAGYGRRLVQRPSVKLDVEIGPGARQTKYDTGEHSRELMARLAATLKWAISSNSEFSEEYTTEYGQDTTVSKSVTALKANLNSQLAMKLSYTIKYTSKVPDGADKTDTESVITLVYNFH